MLVNGSFEQPSVGVGQFLGATSVPGWTAIPGGTIEIWNAHGGVAATNGTNFLELDWASAYDGFFQDVPTIAGQAYTLQFDTRTRPSLSASTMGIEVLWNGALIATVSPTGAWTTRSFTVTGSGGQDRLTIREVSSQSADGLGAMLDNFRLTANGPSNAPPVAGNDTATTNEDVAVAVAVLANDSDPEGQTLTVTHINGTAVAVGGSVDIGPASVTRNANGTLTVTPDANYNGPVNFTYRVSDGVASADANVAVTVNPLNDAPVVAAPIADQSGVVNQAFSFQVAANAFTDVDNPSLTYSAQLVGGGALPGWLSFTPATRTFSGTPPGTGPLNIAGHRQRRDALCDRRLRAQCHGVERAACGGERYGHDERGCCGDGRGARQRQRSGRPDADGDAHQRDGRGGRRQRRYRPCERHAQRQRHADRDAGRQL